MRIYVDSECRCHVSNPDNTLREIEDRFFDNKCSAFIEGYCYNDRMGYTQIYPIKPYSELDSAQKQYEADLEEAAAAYQEGVNTAYDQ